MKLIMENWKKFTNEAKNKTGMIDTIRGREEVTISYELGNFFIYKSGKGSKTHYIVTHAPSGFMIPSNHYFTNYGGKFSGIKRMLKDIDSNPDFAELSSAEPSIEILQALSDFISGAGEGEGLNESASQETSDNFKTLATAFGAVSDSIADDTEASEEMKEKFDELYSKFEEIGLDKIPDLGELMQNVENGEGLADLTKSLEDAGVKPEEIGEKLEQIQILRDEFDEYKTEQEESQKERDDRQIEKDDEQDKAMKDASRMGTDAGNEAQADAER